MGKVSGATGAPATQSQYVSREQAAKDAAGRKACQQLSSAIGIALFIINCMAISGSLGSMNLTQLCITNISLITVSALLNIASFDPNMNKKAKNLLIASNVLSIALAATFNGLALANVSPFGSMQAMGIANLVAPTCLGLLAGPVVLYAFRKEIGQFADQVRRARAQLEAQQQAAAQEHLAAQAAAGQQQQPQLGGGGGGPGVVPAH